MERDLDRKMGDKRIYKYYEAWVALHEAHDIVFRAQEERFQEIAGVNFNQIQILFLVKTLQCPVTAAEISRWLFREPNTIKSNLDRMEAQNLIRRVSYMPKKNIIRIDLTEKGEIAYKRAIESEILGEIMADLSDTEIKDIVSITEKLGELALPKISSISLRDQEEVRSRFHLWHRMISKNNPIQKQTVLG